ncbi:MAG: hypothetical protein ABJB34_06645 [Acidobacteriota bacterium]
MVTVKNNEKTDAMDLKVDVLIYFLDENKKIIAGFTRPGKPFSGFWGHTGGAYWFKPGEAVVKVAFEPPPRQPLTQYDEGLLKGKKWRLGFVVAVRAYPYKKEDEARYIDFLPEQYIQP